jgi:hypothetical protein
MKTKQLTRRQARWSMFFNEFNFVLTHRPGNLSGKPDHLSRRPDYYSNAKQDPENFIQLIKPSQVHSSFKELCSLYSSKLIKNDSLHSRLGHVGQKTLLKTLKATKGLTLSGPVPKTLCDACECGKANRKSIPRSGNGNHELLEVIEMDSQGPFPVTAHDVSS